MTIRAANFRCKERVLGRKFSPLFFTRDLCEVRFELRIGARILGGAGES